MHQAKAPLRRPTLHHPKRRSLLKAQEKELKASIKVLENRLKAALKDYTEGHLDGDLVASWRPQTRAAYEVAESTFRTLRLHGKRSA